MNTNSPAIGAIEPLVELLVRTDNTGRTNSEAARVGSCNTLERLATANRKNQDAIRNNQVDS